MSKSEAVRRIQEDEDDMIFRILDATGGEGRCLLASRGGQRMVLGLRDGEDPSEVANRHGLRILAVGLREDVEKVEQVADVMLT